MALKNLSLWTEQLIAAVHLALSGFEQAFGYQPGANKIELSAPLRQVTGVADLPPEMDQFFSRVTSISLPDIWNGYFLGPADDMVEQYRRGLLNAAIVNGRIHAAFAFGSDGGGGYFVLDLDDGGAVLLMSDSFLEGGVLQGRSRLIAASLDMFLDALLANVLAFGRGQDPTF